MRGDPRNRAARRGPDIKLCECSQTSPILSAGSEFTLGFRIEGDPEEQIYGLGLSVYGYNESVIGFVSGESVPSIFHGVVIPGLGAFDGLQNNSPTPLVESAIGASGNRVQVFGGVDLRPRTFNPLDPGLDGVVGGGDAQVRVTFRATGPGTTNLIVGTRYNGDGVVGAGGRIDHANTLFINATWDRSICPVPEPNTALQVMTGLGLLASRRGRSIWS